MLLSRQKNTQMISPRVRMESEMLWSQQGWDGRCEDCSSIGPIRRFVSGESRTVYFILWTQQRTTSRRPSGIGWFRSGRSQIGPTSSNYLRCAILRLYSRSTILFSISDTLFVYLQSVGVNFEIKFFYYFRDECQMTVIMKYNTVSRQ
jgi:hypothetical protein